MGDAGRSELTFRHALAVVLAEQSGDDVRVARILVIPVTAHQRHQEDGIAAIDLEPRTRVAHHDALVEDHAAEDLLRLAVIARVQHDLVARHEQGARAAREVTARGVAVADAQSGIGHAVGLRDDFDTEHGHCLRQFDAVHAHHQRHDVGRTGGQAHGAAPGARGGKAMRLADLSLRKLTSLLTRATSR